MLHRKQLQEHLIQEAEDCSVGTNAERQRKDSDGGEAGGFAQHAEGEAEVLAEVIPPEPAAGFEEALLSLRDVAESAARGGSGVIFT